jgi:hypothetical protein
VKWFLRRSWREAGGWCDELLPLFAASLLQQQQGQQGQGVSVTTLTSSSAASKRAAAVAAVGRHGMSGIPDDVLLGEYETRAQVAMQVSEGLTTEPSLSRKVGRDSGFDPSTCYFSNFVPLSVGV